MEKRSFAEELSLFATDLFADLLSRHPLFWMLPREQCRSPYFTSEISKCVMLQWSEMRNGLQSKLRSDFPRFAKTEVSFKQYLAFFVDLLMKRERNPICQLFLLPAMLLEIIGFVHRRGVTHFVRDASDYLLFMFSNVKSDDFYEQGGWNLLASEAVKLTKDYDEEEICRQYLSANICGFVTSTASVKIRSPSGNFSETSREILKETSQEVREIVHGGRTEGVKISPEKSVSILQNQESIEVKTPRSNQSEKDLRKEHLVILPTEPSIRDTKDLDARQAEVYEYLKSDRTSLLPWDELRDELRHNVSESAQAAEEESPMKDSSFQTPLEFETSLTTTESIKDFKESSVGREMLDHSRPSKYNISKSIAEYKDSAKDSEKSKDSQAEIGHLSSQSSVKIRSPSEDFSEISRKYLKETLEKTLAVVHKAETEGIENQAEKKVSALDNQESIEVKASSPNQSVNNPESLIILPIELSIPDTKNVTVECVKGNENLEGNIISQLLQTEEGHIVSESAEASEKESPIKDSSFQTPLQPAKGNDSSTLSPKSEVKKMLKPVKDAETPSSDKHDTVDVKAETPASGLDQKVTPNSVETRKSSTPVALKGGKTGNKTEKDVKNVSPRKPLKIPPHKLLPENRKLPTASDITKSSASDHSTPDSKHPPGSGAKNKTKVTLASLKSSMGTTSKLVPKQQMTAKDALSGCKNAKNVLSPKAGTGSVKKSNVGEKSVASSTHKSTDASESEAVVGSKDDLDATLDIAEASEKGTKDKKSTPPSSSGRNITRRNRNLSGKKNPKNTKDEKPPWI